MKQLPYLLLAIICSIGSANAQRDTLDQNWSKAFPYNQKQAKDCLIVENHQGHIAAFAAMSGSSLYFFETTIDGQLITEILLPFSKSTVNAVIATSNGYYLLGSSKRKHKEHPAIWKYQKGDSQLRLLTTLTSKGSFHDAVYKAEGEMIITGHSDNKMCVYRYVPAREELSLLYLSAKKGSIGNAIIEIIGSDYIITGNELKEKTPYLKVWKIDNEGSKINTLTYEHAFTSGQDIIQLQNARLNLMIAGIKYTDTLTSTILLELPPNLDIIEDSTYIHSIRDDKKVATVIIENDEADIILAGKTSPYGSIADEAWLERIKKDAQHQGYTYFNQPDTQWTEIGNTSYPGTITDMIKLKTGDYLIAGIDESERYQNPVLFYIKSDNNPCQKPLETLAPQDSFYFTLQQNQINDFHNDQFLFSGYLVSKNKLSERHIDIFNKSNISGLRLPVQLEALPSLPGQHCYYLEQQLKRSTKGTDEVILSVVKKNRIQFEKTYHNDFRTDVPNLHLITIGINYRLDYTDRDALEIDSLFSMQEGRLFKRVYNYSLTQDIATKGDTIIDFFTKFCDNKYYPKVEEKDVVLLFISSHGMVIKESGSDNDSFIIPAIDFDLENYKSNNTLYVHYDRNIISNLDKLPGKKVIFIDACKSGSTSKGFEDQPIHDGQKKILNTPEGFVTLASSEENQESVECPHLSNGVFTYAIVEALSNANKALDVDQNSDQLVSIQELYEYLDKRMPYLIEECAAKEQNPILINDPLRPDLKDLPIFLIGKNYKNQ